MKNRSEKGPSASSPSSNLEDEVIRLTAKKRVPAKAGTNRGRDLENSSIALTPDKMVREFLEIVHGKKIDPATPFLDLIDMMRKWVPREEHIRILGGLGLACLTANTLRGNVRAGDSLAQRMIGTIDTPFIEKVQGMSLDEAMAEFDRERQRFLAQCREQGIDPNIAEQLLAGAAE